jgi:small subunit ribosomal protein S20
MANHESSKKRIRQTEKRTLRNKAIRTNVRSSVRSVRKALEAKDSKAAETALATAVRRIDMAVSKGVLHQKTGSRYVSRLRQQVSKLAA